MFTIRLPVRTPAGSSAETKPPEAAVPLPRCTVLVVDHEPEVGALLVEMLAAGGHRVDTVATVSPRWRS